MSKRTICAAAALALVAFGASDAAADEVVSTGVFHNASHAPQDQTSGHVSIVKTAKGYELRVADDFESSWGPDIKFVLSAAPDAHDDKTVTANKALIVAPRQKRSGAQSYPLPPEYQPGAYKSVVVWCQTFAVQFGTAPLVPK